MQKYIKYQKYSAFFYFMFSHFLLRSYLLNYTHKIINLHNNPQFSNYNNCVICNNIEKN